MATANRGNSPKLHVNGKVAPEFYSLRDRALIVLKTEAQTGNAVVVTSCHAGEGVTTVSVSFAMALAAAGKGRIAVCDANLTTSSLTGLFGLDAGPGFTDLLAGSCEVAEAAVRADRQSIDVIPAGRQEMVLSQAIDSHQFDIVMDQLRTRYAFVVFDAPPVLDCTATARLAGAADGTILVIEAERERWEVAQKAKDLLEGAGARILGAVLNKRRFHIPSWLYDRLL